MKKLLLLSVPFERVEGSQRRLFVELNIYHLMETTFSSAPNDSHIGAFFDATAATLYNFSVYLVNYMDTCNLIVFQRDFTLRGKLLQPMTKFIND